MHTTRSIGEILDKMPIYTELPVREEIMSFRPDMLVPVIKRAGIPVRYCGFALNDFVDMGICPDEIRDDWGRCAGFYIRSSLHGVGKSTLAVAMAVDRLSPQRVHSLAGIRTWETWSVDEAALTRQLVRRRTYEWFDNCLFWVNIGALYTDASEVILRAQTAQLLIIDDISMARCKEFVWTALAQIVGCRVENNAPLIITSNATIEELMAVETAAVGSAFVGSRLNELYEIEVRGSDRRGECKKKYVCSY